MPYGLVTVFGGSGFLGRFIVERLHTAGARVRVAVRHSTQGPPPQGGDIEVVYADVRDGGTVAQAVRDSDAVVNAVGLYVPQGKATFQAVHVDGAQEVARAARAAGIECLVHISGIGADLNSESAYVRSRALGERAVREAYPEAIILRPSVLFGRGDALFRSLAAITRISPVFPLFGDGSTRLQPVFVGDVAEAVVKAVGSPATRENVYETRWASGVPLQGARRIGPRAPEPKEGPGSGAVLCLGDPSYPPRALAEPTPYTRSGDTHEKG